MNIELKKILEKVLYPIENSAGTAAPINRDSITRRTTPITAKDKWPRSLGIRNSAQIIITITGKAITNRYFTEPQFCQRQFPKATIAITSSKKRISKLIEWLFIRTNDDEGR